MTHQGEEGQLLGHRNVRNHKKTGLSLGQDLGLGPGLGLGLDLDQGQGPGHHVEVQETLIGLHEVVKGTHRVEADTMIDDRHTSSMVMEEVVTDTGPLPLGSGDMRGVEEGMLLEEALEEGVVQDTMTDGILTTSRITTVTHRIGNTTVTILLTRTNITNIAAIIPAIRLVHTNISSPIRQDSDPDLRPRPHEIRSDKRRPGHRRQDLIATASDRYQLRGTIP